MKLELIGVAAKNGYFWRFNEKNYCYLESIAYETKRDAVEALESNKIEWDRPPYSQHFG